MGIGELNTGVGPVMGSHPLHGGVKAETHDATNGGDTSRRQVPSSALLVRQGFTLIWSLRYVARIQTSLNSCDRSQRQNSVAATIIFTCHTGRFVAATCRGDVSQRFVASCVSALKVLQKLESTPDADSIIVMIHK